MTSFLAGLILSDKNQIFKELKATILYENKYIKLFWIALILGLLPHLIGFINQGFPILNLTEIKELREDFWKNVTVPGKLNELNKELEKAGRVADFLELGELFAKDALTRNESCGGHFREEYATKEGEAKRDDKNFTFVSAWEHVGEPSEAKLHKEKLDFENIEVKERSYK